MKDDREFINGIYEKAQKLQVEEKMEQINKEEENTSKLLNGLGLCFSKLWRSSKMRAGMAVVAMAAVACILIPNFISTRTQDTDSYNEDPGIALSSYEDEDQRGLPVATVASSGIILDKYSSNGEDYYLIEQGEPESKGLESSNLIVLYNNGFFSDILDDAMVGTKVEFSFVDTQIQVSQEQEDKIRTQFASKIDKAEQLCIFPINSIQIKE